MPEDEILNLVALGWQNVSNRRRTGVWRGECHGKDLFFNTSACNQRAGSNPDAA